MAHCLKINQTSIAYEDYMLDFMQFFGINYELEKNICPITQCLMIKPVYCDNIKQSSDQISTILYWLHTQCSNPDNPSWKFIHFTTHELCDLRDFQDNATLQQFTNDFFERCEDFKLYLKEYELFKITNELYETLNDAIDSVINKFFEGDQQNKIKEIYKKLKGENLTHSKTYTHSCNCNFGYMCYKHEVKKIQSKHNKVTRMCASVTNNLSNLLSTSKIIEGINDQDKKFGNVLSEEQIKSIKETMSIVRSQIKDKIQSEIKKKDNE